MFVALLFCTYLINDIYFFSGRASTVKNRVSRRFKVLSRLFFKLYSKYNKLKMNCSDLEELGSGEGNGFSFHS